MDLVSADIPKIVLENTHTQTLIFHIETLMRSRLYPLHSGAVSFVMTNLGPLISKIKYNTTETSLHYAVRTVSISYLFPVLPVVYGGPKGAEPAPVLWNANTPPLLHTLPFLAGKK